MAHQNLRTKRITDYFGGKEVKLVVAPYSFFFFLNKTAQIFLWQPGTAYREMGQLLRYAVFHILG